MAMAAESEADRRRAIVHKSSPETDPHTPSPTFHPTLVRWSYAGSFVRSFPFNSSRLDASCLPASSLVDDRVLISGSASLLLGLSSALLLSALHVSLPSSSLVALPPNPTHSLNLIECRALHARRTHGIQQPRNECHDCNVVHPSRVARCRRKS